MSLLLPKLPLLFQKLLAALRRFGETMEQHLTDVLMETHPEIAVLDSRAMPPDKQGKIIPFGARAWHTDHTNHTDHT